MAQLAAFWAKLTMLVSTIRFSDIVDILIVAYLIYNVIMLIRKTNSHRLAPVSYTHLTLPTKA